jgi:hypothetical protein
VSQLLSARRIKWLPAVEAEQGPDRHCRQSRYREINNHIMMLEEAAVAAQTNKLSPVVFTRVTVGADVAEANAAVIRTSGMRVKVAGGTDLAVLISGQDDTGWDAPGACA